MTKKRLFTCYVFKEFTLPLPYCSICTGPCDIEPLPKKKKKKGDN